MNEQKLYKFKSQLPFKIFDKILLDLLQQQWISQDKVTKIMREIELSKLNRIDDLLINTLPYSWTERYKILEKVMDYFTNSIAIFNSKYPY